MWSGDQQCVEVDGGAFFGPAEQVQAIQGSLQEPENQSHLPPVRIQQDDLERGQFQSIGQVVVDMP